ncbi:SRPBCC family protein [Rhizohabitans arisaemae]|uniref:SRPBCC family protein n=1 Tax=Rhizohabitans arisaemae TaxID=2720610 RepID=UPI0024B1EB76|nr:SRPBCC family protein [Rhizohabitans arisaemae]
MSGLLRIRAQVPAPILEVRHALTDPAALRVWLAEHAEADLPHSFAFWGRYTPQGDVPRQRPLYADDRTLRFSWEIDGVETAVEIGLTPTGRQTTILTLTQSHVPDWSEVVAEVGLRSVLATFWPLAITNLIDFLLGRELTPKCDFTSPRLAEQVVVDAPPHEVFDSLVDPGKVREWFGAPLEIELRPGGRWAMGGFDREESTAKIVDVVPGRRLDLDWGSFVSSWELEGSEGRTRFTFVQSGFDEDNPPYAGWLGWLSAVADLRRFHETSWTPIWLQSDIPGMPEDVLVLASEQPTGR